MIRKLCAHCRTRFEPERPSQIVHIECVEAWTLAQAAKRGREEAKRVRAAEKMDRADAKRRKEAVKSRSKWLAEAQTAFNSFIRARDAGQPCISCGRHHQGQYHAGHYLSVGARPELRFEEANVHKQCAPCNNHLSGNAVLFRRGLLEKLGLEIVEWLEGPHEPKKYTIAELIEIKSVYRMREKSWPKN